jgi:hypothetical protein
MQIGGVIKRRKNQKKMNKNKNGGLLDRQFYNIMGNTQDSPYNIYPFEYR